MNCFIQYGTLRSASTDSVLWWVLSIKGCPLSLLRLSITLSFLYRMRKTSSFLLKDKWAWDTYSFLWFFWSCISSLGVKESYWFLTFYYFTALCHCSFNILVKIILWALPEIWAKFSIRSGLSVILSYLSLLWCSLSFWSLTKYLVFLCSDHSVSPQPAFLLTQCPDDKTIVLSPPTKTLTSWLSNRKLI